MTIELTDGTYVRAMWFVDGGDKDWMGVVLKQKGEGFKGVYRFRYIENGISRGAEDEKHWYKILPKKNNGADELEKVFDEYANDLAEFCLGSVDKTVVDGNGGEAMGAICHKPWFNFFIDKEDDGIIERCRICNVEE